MNTYRELVYMTLDQLKLVSDDAQFTEEHVIFLLDKYRAFVLKQRYSDIKKIIPKSNYQTIKFKVIEDIDKLSTQCTNIYLRTEYPVPDIIYISNPKVYTCDYYNGEITYVSRDRMKYTGYNKYLKNIVYCSLDPDNYLYFKSNSKSLEELKNKNINITAVFNTPSSVVKDVEEILDIEFPLEEALIPNVLELTIKDLAGSIYKPKDDINNAKDDLEDLASYLARNLKNKFEKQLSE